MYLDIFVNHIIIFAGMKVQSLCVRLSVID